MGKGHLCQNPCVCLYIYICVCVYIQRLLHIVVDLVIYSIYYLIVLRCLVHLSYFYVHLAAQLCTYLIFEWKHGERERQIDLSYKRL